MTSNADRKVGFLKLHPSPAAAALSLRCSRSAVSSAWVQKACEAVVLVAIIVKQVFYQAGMRVWDETVAVRETIRRR